MRCESNQGNRKVLNEVCFFKTGATGRLAGAAIHDGFILRKGSKVVLIGTETGIADADDPRAEAVMQVFPPAPVLLIELEPKGNEPVIFYGYLVRVNAFSALAQD